MQKTVLIIEDDDSNRRILEVTIRGLGFQVVTAMNGEEGYQLATQKKPDLIIMDVMMPKMSGLDTLRQLRMDAHLAETPVLVVSAKAAETDRQNAFDAGATDFITKPFRVKTVQEAIEKYLPTK